MNEYFEIAYAAATNRLCFFTGTGFSKALSSNLAPSWQGLLENLCTQSGLPETIKGTLFPSEGKNPLTLDEAAQIIAIEMARVGQDIHEETAKLVRLVPLQGDNKAVSEFFSTRSFRVVTTNYDKLAETISGVADSQSISPGLPIPRSNTRVKVYHVHGSIDSPKNMVITADDYHKFLGSESYFSRKLSTVLHENTIVILGYSLGDINLKAILSGYRDYSRSHVIGSSIFLVSREAIAQPIVDYYAHSYGIRVLSAIQIPNFFQVLNANLPTAENAARESLDWVKKVLYQGYNYVPQYIKSDISFHTIIPSIAAVGASINDSRVVAVLGDVISKKTELTKENGAFEQYEHLAGWLAYLAEILEIRGTALEGIFLSSTLRSMTTMSRERVRGRSWHAYQAWSSRWSRVTASNRTLIRQHIEANTMETDALEIVRRS